MPFLSVLLDRYTSAKAKGRSDFDWSAIGLSVAEDAGIVFQMMFQMMLQEQEKMLMKEIYINFDFY